MRWKSAPILRITHLLNTIWEDEVNKNVSDDGYAIDIEDNEDTQSEQSFILDEDDIDDEYKQQPVPPAMIQAMWLFVLISTSFIVFSYIINTYKIIIQ